MDFITLKKELAGHRWFINRIVDRCHVGEPYKEVFKYMISRIKGGHTGWLTMDRNTRKVLLCFAMERHDKNRGLFTWINRGLK